MMRTTNRIFYSGVLIFAALSIEPWMSSAAPPEHQDSSSKTPAVVKNQTSSKNKDANRVIQPVTNDLAQTVANKRFDRNAAPADVLEDCDDPLDLLQTLADFYITDRRTIKNGSDGRPVRKPIPTGRRLSAQQLRGCLAVAYEINPELGLKLRQKRAENTVAFEQAMRLHGRRLLGLWQLKQRDKELYDIKMREMQLEGKVQRLSDRYRSARDAGQSLDAEKLLRELQKEVSREVALSIKAREKYVRRLQDHVKHLELQLRQDRVKFNASVKERINTLINQTSENEADGTRQP